MNEITAWQPAETAGRSTPPECSHLGEAREVAPRTDGCEECLLIGSSWVHLRECLSCGHVGCCDSSPGKHAHAHAHAVPGHDLARSIEPGEDWGWCYADEIFLQRVD
jgi:uncharacterized UBP type Zn finger protein